MEVNGINPGVTAEQNLACLDLACLMQSMFSCLRSFTLYHVLLHECIPLNVSWIKTAKCHLSAWVKSVIPVLFR